MSQGLFRSFAHGASGQEFDISFLQQATYIETLGLDGPKLIMSWNDPDGALRDHYGVQELDEIEVVLSHEWEDGGSSGLNIRLRFTILSMRSRGTELAFNCLASPVYAQKKISDKTRVFTRRGVRDILLSLGGGNGVGMDIGAFPVVESYHCLPGERPSAALAQLAKEQGAHIWYARDAWHARTFADLFAGAPAFEYHYGNYHADYQIASYKRASGQARMQEDTVRGFSGWSDTLGRIKASPAGGVLSGATGYAPARTSAQSTQILGRQPIAAMQEAIDFTAEGNGCLAPGMALKLWWHTGDPSAPLDESLPRKVVIQAIAHHYARHTYTCRVKGAVPFEPA